VVVAADAHCNLRGGRRPHLEVDDPIARNGAEHGAERYPGASGYTAILSGVNHVRQFVSRNPRHPHRIFRRRIATALVVVVLSDVVGAVLMYVFEKGERDGVINAFTDAVFFATVQLLTISSQMPNPVTGPGRVTDVALEIVGVFVVTGLAGAFASFFHQVAVEATRELRAFGHEPADRERRQP
jgi:hypothetical protein